MNPFYHYFVVFFAAIFSGNILLSNYLGMCSFVAISRELRTSIGLGIAVIFVMTMTTLLNWLLYHLVLLPLGYDYLRFIMFIIVIASFVQLVEILMERVSETLYIALGIFLPLITVNCAILGASLFMVIRGYDLPTSMVYGFGSGVGWFLAIVLMAGIRQKLNESGVPAGLRGAGITLIISGIMALAFMGFSGMIG